MSGSKGSWTAPSPERSVLRATRAQYQHDNAVSMHIDCTCTRWWRVVCTARVAHFDHEGVIPSIIQVVLLFAVRPAQLQGMLTRFVPDLLGRDWTLGRCQTGRHAWQTVASGPVLLEVAVRLPLFAPSVVGRVHIHLLEFLAAARLKAPQPFGLPARSCVCFGISGSDIDRAPCPYRSAVRTVAVEEKSSLSPSVVTGSRAAMWSLRRTATQQAAPARLRNGSRRQRSPTIGCGNSM